MFGLGGMEILVILLVGVVVLGPERLPKVMRTVTRLMSDFRRVSTDLQRTINTEINLEEYNRKQQIGMAQQGAKKKKKKKKPAPAPEVAASAEAAAPEIAPDAATLSPASAEEVAAPSSDVAPTPEATPGAAEKSAAGGKA